MKTCRLWANYMAECNPAATRELTKRSEDKKMLCARHLTHLSKDRPSW
jgi:hypothetical protein